MRADGIWNWTLPAWVVTLRDGQSMNVCPQAGACAQVCYARNGTYRFSNVKSAHMRNLEHVVNDLPGWTSMMRAELQRRRYKPKNVARLPDLNKAHLSSSVATLLDIGAACVRIHDSGDFFSEEYLMAWLQIAEDNPQILFYAYTKEVALFKAKVEGHAPENFLYCFSMGGRQDKLVDRSKDRHADVFPSVAEIARAGYYDQSANDLLCVVAPSNRIGIPSNNIPSFNKKLAGRTFADFEAEQRRHSSPLG
jgi:hypothetical protein